MMPVPVKTCVNLRYQKLKDKPMNEGLAISYIYIYISRTVMPREVVDLACEVNQHIYSSLHMIEQRARHRST
jgi:hypothetical protein